jgi:DNA-binding CsgD family transcriptional regulator
MSEFKSRGSVTSLRARAKTRLQQRTKFSRDPFRGADKFRLPNASPNVGARQDHGRSESSAADDSYASLAATARYAAQQQSPEEPGGNRACTSWLSDWRAPHFSPPAAHVALEATQANNFRCASALETAVESKVLLDELELVSTLILCLYQFGHDLPIDQFRRWALDRLRELIPFDSTMWGTGSESPQAINEVFLYNQPQGMIDEYVQGGWQAQDFLRTACVTHPSQTINLSDLISRDDWHRTALYREFTRKYGVEWILCTVQVEPVSSLNAFVSLWRSDTARPFTESERRRKQLVMPHLIESMRINRLWNLQAEVTPRAYRLTHAVALCDRSGTLHECSRSFAALIGSEWPRWTGAQLPPLLINSLTEGKYEGKHINVSFSAVGDHWLLRADSLGVADRLGRREREVARLYARGMSHRAIARSMGIAPATVRNQLRAGFRKLGVSNKVELARVLGEVAGSG